MILKRISSLILYLFITSCLWEGGGGLQVVIINQSSSDIYVGEVDAFDTKMIDRIVHIYCNSGDDGVSFPRTLSAGDSTILLTKFKSGETIHIIPLDSLKKFCSEGRMISVADKNWIKIESAVVDIKSKSCKFIIK